MVLIVGEALKMLKVQGGKGEACLVVDLPVEVTRSPSYTKM